jgi:hypothetical protein
MSPEQPDEIGEVVGIEGLDQRVGQLARRGVLGDVDTGVGHGNLPDMREGPCARQEPSGGVDQSVFSALAAAAFALRSVSALS